MPPINAAVALLHQGPQPAARIRPRGERRRTLAGSELVDGGQHRRGRRLCHLVAIDAGLLCRAQREFGRGPDRPGIHLGLGLQHRDAPRRRAFLQGPVERRRSAVADDARMHDEADMALPDRLGNRATQVRRDDQIGAEQRHGFLGDAVRNVELDRDFMAAFPQLGAEALRQAVEGVGQEQDAHRQTISKCAATGRPPASRRCACRQRP
jgi:hypothetical protein